MKHMFYSYLWLWWCVCDAIPTGGGHHPACHQPWRLAGTGAGALCEQLLASSVEPGYEGGLVGPCPTQSYLVSSALNVELREV